MKIRLSLFFIFLCALPSVAQVHISVADPEKWTAQELQPYIGQDVIFDVPIVVCSNYSYDLKVSTRRLFSPTNQARPNTPEYVNIMTLNTGGSVTLTGVSGYHRCGEKIYHLKAHVNSTSSLRFISGEWRGNTRAVLESGIPDLGDYRLLVCGMNLEYYLVANTGSGTMGPSSYSEHQAQRTKVNKALTRINADLYGLVEIEQGQEALKEIASDLNAKLPKRNYKYIDDGTSPNGTFTKSGYVYDANTIRPIGSMQHIETGVQKRKKMMCFEEIATGERFIYSINHFKAKRSGTGATGANTDQGDGQGFFNAMRLEEAQAVISRYKSFYQQMHDKDVLFMGDLNAYAKEDPIHLFMESGMIDLHRTFNADSSYSYVYGEAAGYLDHAICNPTLLKQVTGATAYHINSDEDDRYTYDKSSDLTMFRCSDHDPVLVGLKLDSTVTYDPAPAINNLEILAGEADQLIISNAYKDGQKSFYAIVDVSGRLVTRKEITTSFHYIPLPETAGIYILYIYADGQVYQRKIIVR